MPTVHFRLRPFVLWSLLGLLLWARGRYARSFDQVGFQLEFLIRSQSDFSLKGLIPGETDLKLMLTGRD